MTKEQVKQRILEVKIVPVVRASSPEQALGAADAVRAGGIPIVEVTMTVPGAIEVIAGLSRLMGSDVLIGAGTVLDAATAQKCLDAGAQFLVSPGFDAETVALARRLNVLIMPGSLTPTEVITAWKAGADFVKIFPCGNVGGPAYIKSLKAALPQIPMIPTGGVNLETAAAFLRAGASALGIGGELISKAALDSGNFAAITESARQYTAIVNQRV
ncbi:MAG: bifunctional 4-hydroxy-2-oxoglutarate aldolase/2-dehydro-3-deoxy-phosphogluconate aldolase [Bryobacteraceae bacterium]|jgi:2-dehydro-3-deoxyphosphogluconate aldolase/(4S)-4-hydroxy-2-oxoglutarate aldolase